MRVDSSNISDAFISYKGHGMIERASRINSIGHVVAHENRHLAHFRNYAEYQGKEITRENITIKYAFVDGKLVAVAGEAKAQMVDKPDDKTSATKSADGSTESNDDNKNDINKIADNAQDEQDSKKQKLDVLLSRIESAIKRLDNKLNEIENDQSDQNDKSGDKASRIEYKITRLEEKKDKIISKRNEIEAEELLAMVEDSLKDISELTDQAAGLIEAIYGLKSGKQIGHQTDKQTEVSIPDYSMLFTGMVLDTIA